MVAVIIIAAILGGWMLSWEDDVEAHALRRRGWSISAIARHLGHDRKTVRAYLRGEREPGQRAGRGPDVMAPFVEYCRIRLADDPHLWASALLDELRELGYAGSYPSLTAAIRARGLRPHCEPCQASAGRDAAIIAHPPGEETQFDWLELPGPPPGWGCGGARAPAGWGTVSLGPLARGAGRGRGLRALGRGSRCGSAQAGRADPPVADVAWILTFLRWRAGSSVHRSVMSESPGRL